MMKRNYPPSTGAIAEVTEDETHQSKARTCENANAIDKIRTKLRKTLKGLPDHRKCSLRVSTQRLIQLGSSQSQQQNAVASSTW